MLPPGSWLGCLGGGQLGRMFVHAAQALGYKVLILDPDASGPAAQAADDVIVAAYDDAAAIDRFARRVAAVTTEFENVPATTLERLAANLPTRPGAEAVRIAQDRRREKRFFADHGLPVGRFAIIERADDLGRADVGLFPGILKTATLGYDGKGQWRVNSREQALLAWMSVGQPPCVLEALVPFHREISVLVARSRDGAVAVWPVQENEHRDGILARTLVPARLDEGRPEAAQVLAARLVAALDYVGVLAVEMFVTADGLLLNEMAPRPHNSGHYTIEACETSQFEQQARILAAAPLGATTLVQSAVMVNVLGDVWFDGEVRREPRFADVLALPGAHLHLYGKAEARRGRKMGHVTCTAPTLTEALATADAVSRALGIPQ
ncbi:MAG: 5-(carboxyamino)imidazole ribonucleotide synthase [Burkholderiales bacterium]|nr:5-(carboxyamino)imidazole ribonucleotide synthase [Burkholderiales bacterium]MCZ2136330.1 5-(carboxyamino)imidazole ribonucleotide synthase [Burkholderiales bacterium]